LLFIFSSVLKPSIGWIILPGPEALPKDELLHPDPVPDGMDGISYLAKGLSLRMSSSTLTLSLMVWMEFLTWPRDSP
jgi:hypothetical protein